MKAGIAEKMYAILGTKTVDAMRFAKANHILKKNGLEVFENRKNNTIYKDSHKGKRCFILGNGPSLKTVDLGALTDEFVFSVNNFAQVQDYKKAKPDVHLWMDLSFFNLRDDQKYDTEELMKNFYAMGELNPICFLPEESYAFVKENHLEQKLDIHYLSTFDHVLEKKEVYADISKPVTGFATVVQYAIVIAAYMGFQEIYLLGCDTTNIVSVINCALDISNQNMHAYDNDDVNKRYKEMLNKWSMTEIFYDQYILFLGYKKLYETCAAKGIQLVNCSETTIINEIPRKKLSDVLQRK